MPNSRKLVVFQIFCDVREPVLRTSCSKGCTRRVHETKILGTTPKLLIINTSRNTTSTNFCQMSVVKPPSLYLDVFIGDSYGSINYRLISVIYRYLGHFGCSLFNRDDTSASVLCDLWRQKHAHIAVYVLERNANSQFYPNDENFLWSCKEENLKVVKSIYYDN